jgi:transposase
MTNSSSLSDEKWAILEPLLPEILPQKKRISGQELRYWQLSNPATMTNSSSLSDEKWAILEPLLPEILPQKKRRENRICSSSCSMGD